MGLLHCHMGRAYLTSKYARDKNADNQQISILRNDIRISNRLLVPILNITYINISYYVTRNLFCLVL